MRLGQTVRETELGELIIEKPWVWKVVSVLVWLFLWIFMYYAVFEKVIPLTFKVIEEGEATDILSIMAIYGFLIVLLYYTVTSIYQDVLKDRNIKIRTDLGVLIIKMGGENLLVNTSDIKEIRLKKIANSQGGYSLNLSLVTKQRQLLLLIKSNDEICYELADRLNRMIGAEINMY